ncbi:hypothetical protein DYU11_20070 [Fibrisoma montanum]|uniref:Uncharacterized protein n=1 Tax=Fibrisoma montanum TaxID=2305895 RepID=A0A418M3M6_9BACT|nr:hypothetical protein [Fibrisoma montanum]RIV20350.1 hypothetical protein DYU11_20070 [Fibrisoma montanum]
MKLSPAFVTFALVGAVFIASGLAVRECSYKQGYRAERDLLVKDTVRLRRWGNELRQQVTTLQRDNARAIAAGLRYRNGRDSAVAQTDALVAQKSRLARQVGILERLRGNGTLDVRYVTQIDTVRQLIADPTVELAVAKTVEREAYFRKQNDSLANVTGLLSVQVDNLENDVQDANGRLQSARAKVLNEAATGRFLGIGRKKAMRELAQEMK